MFISLSVCLSVFKRVESSDSDLSTIHSRSLSRIKRESHWWLDYVFAIVCYVAVEISLAKT